MAADPQEHLTHGMHLQAPRSCRQLPQSSGSYSCRTSRPAPVQLHQLCRSGQGCKPLTPSCNAPSSSRPASTRLQQLSRSGRGCKPLTPSCSAPSSSCCSSEPARTRLHRLWHSGQDGEASSYSSSVSGSQHYSTCLLGPSQSWPAAACNSGARQWPYAASYLAAGIAAAGPCSEAAPRVHTATRTCAAACCTPAAVSTEL